MGSQATVRSVHLGESSRAGQVWPDMLPTLGRMDRYSSWQGLPGRARRVPPRAAQRRGGRVRAASWDTPRRWFLVLGSLALAILLPRLLGG